MAERERRERAASVATRAHRGEGYTAGHHDGQVHGEAYVYDVVYRSIVAAAEKAGAVEGDPRWYGINIALRAIMELRDR